MKYGFDSVTGTSTSLARRPCTLRDAPMMKVPGSTRFKVLPSGVSSVDWIFARAISSSERSVAVNVCGYPGRGVTVCDQEA